jgi:DNA-binding MarR family transcriptional regulator
MPSYHRFVPDHPDHVDRMVAAWTRSTPDLDVEPLHLVGRLLRLATLLMRDIERALTAFDLTYGDFDVLSTLLREDDEHGMNPSRLARSALITTGAMTTRLDRLERLGLIARTGDPADRRAVLVRLTDPGRHRARAATEAVLDVDRRFLEPLPDTGHPALTDALRRLLLAADHP